MKNREEEREGEMTLADGTITKLKEEANRKTGDGRGRSIVNG